MSVTVSDLLKLPSLQHARVIGGAGGLKRACLRSPYWNLPIRGS